MFLNNEKKKLQIITVQVKNYWVPEGQARPQSRRFDDFLVVNDYTDRTKSISAENEIKAMRIG